MCWKRETVRKKKNRKKLTVDGTIAAGGSSGLFASEGYNHENFMEQLKAVEEDPTVKGIFLEVNSPGGGVYESAEIAKKLDTIRKEHDIPMYVSMKNMAASGGYYISAQADKIFATEEKTVTGSIGCDHVRIELFRAFRKTGCGRHNSEKWRVERYGIRNTATQRQKRRKQCFKRILIVRINDCKNR